MRAARPETGDRFGEIGVDSNPVFGATPAPSRRKWWRLLWLRRKRRAPSIRRVVTPLSRWHRTESGLLLRAHGASGSATTSIRRRWATESADINIPPGAVGKDLTVTQSRQPLISRAHAAAWSLAAILLGTTCANAGVTPVDTAFTYQGQLRDASGSIDGTASFRFRLFNAALGGVQQGPTLTACGVALTDGLFTVDLDFGENVFDGSGRWLEISVQSPSGDCATFTPLTPRQTVLPAPYAIRSLKPWESDGGSSIHYTVGSVGIGTTSPDTQLEVEAPDATVRVTSTAANTGTSRLDLKGESPTGLGSNVLGSVRFLDQTNATRAELSSSLGFLASPFNFIVDGTTQVVIGSSGNLGVGTTLPVAKVQIDGGTDSEPGSGGYLVIGPTNAGNLSFDNNEIMARNSGATSTLFLNNEGGDVSICANGGGQVGIGTSPTASQLTVFNSLFVNGGATPRIDVGPNGFILMDTGGDIVITEGGLEVNTTSAGQTFFNRVNPDGTLVGFLNDGTSAGSISVVGSTVIYGTFTGAHNGWTEESIRPGTLVSLVGEVRRGHEGPNCEPTYGIATTRMANDPRCGGSYVCPPDPADPASHHLFAAVGNGEMWVVDSGTGDIAAGDALISSDVAGAAMKDDPARFAIGHVVGRAAEPVRWASVAPGADGTRRVLLSVFYDRFERQGDAVEMRGTIDALRAENDSLRLRLEAIEARLDAMTAPTAGGSR